VVGLEALARGPDGSAFSTPDRLFTAAAEHGRVAELDWICRTAAFKAVMDAGVPGSMSLFVNIEPESLSSPCPGDLKHLLTRAESQLRIFVEINDRALAMEPAGLLAAVDRARRMGWGISLDDVGASRGCLAMIPVVQPDVIKLDFRLLAASTEEHTAVVLSNVHRHVERTGACLVGEGLEDEDDVRLARALGAQFGQGLYFGMPGPLADNYSFPRAVVPVVGRPTETAAVSSPHALVSSGHQLRLGPDEFSRLVHLAAHRVRTAPGRPTVLASLGPNEVVDTDGLTLLAGVDALLLVTFGVGLPPRPAPGVRGVRVAPSDPLAVERFVVILTEEFSMALLARPVPGARHLYDAVLTQDPDAVQEVARHLIRRVPPAGPRNRVLPPPVLQPSTDVEHVEAKARPVRPGGVRRLADRFLG
jgi:EAL domain-containing protein (putative c-di-GMP-specific phosphodiesterase class I)